MLKIVLPQPFADLAKVVLLLVFLGYIYLD